VDRIELMIRDADAEWAGRFGARAVFAMQGVAETSRSARNGKAGSGRAHEELWRRVKAEPAPTTSAAALASIRERVGGEADRAAERAGHADRSPRGRGGVRRFAATIEAFAARRCAGLVQQVVVGRELAGGAAAWRRRGPRS